MPIHALISFLIFCVILGLVLWIVYKIISLVPGVEPFKQIALVVVLVIGLLILLERALPLLGY
jgi:hypothetical protein